MKTDWEVKTLGEVCTLQRGFDLPKHSRNEGDYPLISSSGASDTIDSWKVKAPGVVTGRSGSIGKIFFIEQDFWPLNTTLYVKDFHGNEPRFVYHLLNQFDLGKYSSGAGVPTLNRNFVHDELVLIPRSISEQQRIVAILDEAFAAIDKAKENTQKNLQNARELFESYLQSVFANPGEGWERVKLTDLATDITDGDHMPPPKSETGVPFITISNIHKESNKIDFSDTFMVSPEYYKNLKPNRKPKKGDVLYTVTGSFGIPVIVESDVEFCFQRHIGLIRPKSQTDSKWLYYLILSPQVFKQGNDGATGTAQRTVSLSVLRNFDVPKVPLEEQQTIVAKLDAISAETKKLEAIYQQKLTDLDELKKSILQKAFQGELSKTPGIALCDS